MKEINDEDKSVPTITLQDSYTQTPYVETVSVGTKKTPPPPPKHIGAQAVVEQVENEAQAKPVTASSGC